MYQNKTVSIIIPVYNTAPFLSVCIQSILEQTYKDIEILIVNDGSTDRSGAICLEFASGDSRIKYIEQKNSGVVSARRNGTEHATGEYVMYVDSDDLIEKDMVEFLVLHIEDADLITSGVFYEVRQGMLVEYKDKYLEGIYRLQEREQLLKTMLYDMDSDELQRLTPWIWNKLYRTSIVKAIYKDLDTDITFAEDAVFLYKYLLRCGTIKVCHKCLYHYQYREGSAFHRENPRMLMDINKAYLALVPDFSRHLLSASLLVQLQHWVSVMAVMAVNGGMGFSDFVNIPEFLLDTEGLKGKKIVVYGAGKMGKDYYMQLTKMGYNVVLWVDGSDSRTQNVKPPSEILQTDFDMILIAVSRQEYVKNIKQTLQDIGIEKEKIIWRTPVRTV